MPTTMMMKMMMTKNTVVLAAMLLLMGTRHIMVEAVLGFSVSRVAVTAVEAVAHGPRWAYCIYEGHSGLDKCSIQFTWSPAKKMRVKIEADGGERSCNGDDGDCTVAWFVCSGDACGLNEEFGFKVKSNNNNNWDLDDLNGLEFSPSTCSYECTGTGDGEYCDELKLRSNNQRILKSPLVNENYPSPDYAVWDVETC